MVWLGEDVHSLNQVKHKSRHSASSCHREESRCPCRIIIIIIIIIIFIIIIIIIIIIITIFFS